MNQSVTVIMMSPRRHHIFFSKVIHDKKYDRYITTNNNMILCQILYVLLVSFVKKS